MTQTLHRIPNVPRNLFAILVVVALSAVPFVATGASDHNAVTNGDFEAGLTGWLNRVFTVSIVSPGADGTGHAVFLPEQANGPLIEQDLAPVPDSENGYVIEYAMKIVSGRDLANDAGLMIFADDYRPGCCGTPALYVLVVGGSIHTSIGGVGSAGPSPADGGWHLYRVEISPTPDGGSAARVSVDGAFLSESVSTTPIVPPGWIILGDSCGSPPGVCPRAPELAFDDIVVRALDDQVTALGPLFAQIEPDDLAQPKRYDAFQAKADDVDALVSDGGIAALCEAHDKTVHDILPKTDGKPKPADWVVDPDAQERLEEGIRSFLEHLEGSISALGGCP